MDKPTPAQAALAGPMCSAFDLYYGSDAPSRFRKARWCAFAQLGMFRSGTVAVRAKQAQTWAAGGATNPEDLRESDGLTVLMLYANGEGVAQNVKVAQELACRFAFGSPEGDEQRMPALLQSLRAGRRFDLCGEDQGPQGRAVWYACAVTQAGKAAEQGKIAEGVAERDIPPAERRTWSAVEKAWRELSRARAESAGAQCAGGTGCGVISAQDDLAMKKSWLAKLKMVRWRALPSDLPQASELPALDKELNEVYQQQIAEALPATNVLGQPNDLASLERRSERAWIRFRDAWTTYAAMHWPEIPADRWRAYLTAEWIKVLQQN